jgi:hypothetical protein
MNLKYKYLFLSKYAWVEGALRSTGMLEKSIVEIGKAFNEAQAWDLRPRYPKEVKNAPAEDLDKHIRESWMYDDEICFGCYALCRRETNNAVAYYTVINDDDEKILSSEIELNQFLSSLTEKQKRKLLRKILENNREFDGNMHFCD